MAELIYFLPSDYERSEATQAAGARLALPPVASDNEMPLMAIELFEAERLENRTRHPALAGSPVLKFRVLRTPGSGSTRPAVRTDRGPPWRSGPTTSRS